MNYKWDLNQYKFDDASVSFTSEDKDLQGVFDDCEELCKQNIKTFGDYDVLIEGAKYNGVWLETQPMGGEMYAKRSIKTALANILIFLRYQRRDGRFPGMISYRDPWSGLVAHYDWMQGCFLPYPALKLYYLIGEDKDYLNMLYTALEDFDNYLWRYRDSTGNGCLENWCIWDVGEDNSTPYMLNGLKMPEHGPWGKSTPPEDYMNLPYKSPQYMGYSYACRKVLAHISGILENGLAEKWEEDAKAVQAKAYECLWDKEKHAFYLQDKNGEVIPALTQENIKCMYCGLLTQEMADAFVKEHLLNEEEFWTEYPLPAIAANDKYFHLNEDCSNCAEELKKTGIEAHDIGDNSWSGPLNGLIWQRSIDALINYGYHAETEAIGKKILATLKKHRKYTQNYNPFTGIPANGMDGYGPTMLTALEYISMLCGVNISYKRVFWSAACDMGKFTYTQNMYGNEYKLVSDGNEMQAFINGKEIFKASAGTRIETDLQGKILAVYGISENDIEFSMSFEDKKIEKTLSKNNCIKDF